MVLFLRMFLLTYLAIFDNIFCDFVWEILLIFFVKENFLLINNKFIKKKI
jgi:hypothetical protein